MKTTKQILLDKLVAKPFAYSLNFLVRFLGKLLNIDHNLDKPFKTIAVCKFKGMGSIIQSTPMLKSLKYLYPESEIIYVSTCSNKTLLNRISVIDTIVCLDDKNLVKLLSTMLAAIRQLMKKNIDVYIDLEIYSDFSTIVTLFSLSKNRFGYYLRSSSYKLGIYTHMMFFNPRVPISMVYLQMSRLLGFRGPIPGLYKIPVETKLSEKYKDQKYILINPNASDLRTERRWHKNNFRDLTHKLFDIFPNHQFIFIGSKSEMNYTSDVIKDITDNRINNLAGKTTLDELIALIHNAEMLITNDTGPMHFAFSSNTPTVCLFGPCSPEQYGYNNNAYVLYERVYCSPCVHDFIIPPCKGNNVCMQKISLEAVLRQIEQVKNKLPPMHYNLNSVSFYRKNETFGSINR
ncbi:MAG: glycosyltransferase family 9 protein [Bacteroidales bacterium]